MEYRNYHELASFIELIKQEMKRFEDANPTGHVWLSFWNHSLSTGRVHSRKHETEGNTRVDFFEDCDELVNILREINGET